MANRVVDGRGVDILDEGDQGVMEAFLFWAGLRAGRGRSTGG
jgi:hypothetical protein